MLRVFSHNINYQDHPDQISLDHAMDENWQNPPSEVGVPAINDELSATMTLDPGPDRKLTIEELQQQVTHLDSTLTKIKQQLKQLMGGHN